MALGHIACGRVKIFHYFETHGWISFSAGASVAYVFVHVLPEIGIYQEQITGHSGHHQAVSFFNQPLYLTALGGLCFLYLLDTIEAGFYDKASNKLKRHKYYMPIFTARSLIYIIYNFMIAYIVTERPGRGLINITLISIALVLHFIVFNTGFREVYEELYDRYIRWLGIVALLSGWILGVMLDLPDVITVTVFSLIGGMITYTALKSELPLTDHKEPFHFLAGAFLYAFIILAIPFFGLSHLG